MIKLFEQFNSDIEFRKKIDRLISNIPDSDIPSETNIIKEIDDKLIFIEGWCDRCFSNYDLYDMDEMMDFARNSTFDRMSSIPSLPQYREKFKDREMVDYFFVELPDNRFNYAVSVGIFK
jgi:hypothetical protein